jgi:sec-independent protein translocase protein TatC
LPVIIYQVWAFLAPALYKHEKRVVLPVIFGAILLFVSGVALSFYVVLPLAIGWLMGIAKSTDALEPMITYREYFSFAVNMSLAFGLCFELPIVILLLATLGLVTPEFLRRYRRHALVLCVVTGALLSPGDLIWTTMLLAAPLYLLYELSVILTALVYRRRRKRAAQLAAEEAAAAATEGDGAPRRLDSEPWEADESSTAGRGS